MTKSRLHRIWRSHMIGAAIACTMTTGIFSSEGTAASQDSTLFSGTVDSLTIQNWAGPVRITPHDRSDTLVKAEKPNTPIAGLDISTKNNRLVLRGVAIESTSSNGTHRQGDNGTVIIGESTVINRGGGESSVTIGNLVQTDKSQKNEEQPRIEIFVPAGQQLFLKGLLGKITTGDIRATVEMDASGSCDVTFGKILSSHLKASGACDIAVGHIDGDLMLHLEGAGDMNVRDGKIGRLDISLDGAGDVNVEAKADFAKIRLNGVGDISVTAVKKDPDVIVAGVGDVSVGRF